MDILLQKESPQVLIYLRQIKRIVHDNFSACSLNTKSFYHALSVNNSRKSYVTKSAKKMLVEKALFNR